MVKNMSFSITVAVITAGLILLIGLAARTTLHGFKLKRLKKSTQEKLLAIGVITAFALIWAAFVLPYLMGAGWFAALVPPVQYVIYNIGFYLFTVVIVYLPYWWVAKTKVKWEKTLIAGLATWVLFSFVIDMWEPPQYLSTAGVVLITNATSLPGTAVDAMTAWWWSNLGIPTASLYTFTYIITPILAIITAALVFSANAVWKGLQL